MKIRFTKEFFLQYKKADVRIRNRVDEHLRIFKRNPNDASLKNRILKREWIGHRSINITSDCRAIYKEIQIRDEKVIYFVALGTHRQLYKQKNLSSLN